MMTTGMGDLGYASEKISSAIMILATSHGTIQQRLLNAWLSEGHFALPMGPGQAGRPMSQDLIDKLTAFDELMCDRSSGGTYSSTVMALSDDDAVAAAEELFEIEYMIEVESDAD